MNDKIFNVGVIGATGYAGTELVRLLTAHPFVKTEGVSSVSYEGKKISDIYPNLFGICDLTLEKQEDIIPRCAVVFACLPHGLSEPIAKLCVENNCFFIDLGADFRLHDEQDYKKWYGLHYSDPELHRSAVYSIPELHRQTVRSLQPKIIANPGCYPTSASLGLYPAISERIIKTSRILIDSKSGVTGAGRGLTQNTHYPDTNEAFSAYKPAIHRHTPEIEQTLSEIAHEKVSVTFVPHLLPVNRGIETTIYAELAQDTDVDKIIEIYTNYYRNEQFVRILPSGSCANIKNVRYSNYCDISIHIDRHTNTLIICSCIDNMVKGAAGQAIQNMNILLGLDECTALLSTPPSF